MNRKIVNTDILILGAGLSGFCLAYFLRKSGKKIVLVDSKKRIGGRIDTKYIDNSGSIEMGATWIGKKHTNLIELLCDLKIDLFEQLIGSKAIYEPISTSPHYLVDLPENPEPSMRIVGGSMALINGLKENLSNTDFYIDEKITNIKYENNLFISQSRDHTFNSTFIVSTLPPYLLTNTVVFDPHLPKEIIEISAKTHTWMGDSIKVGLVYKNAFWHERGLSGTIFSNVGPVPEMYDHGNVEKTFFALKGFLNGQYFSLSKEERQHMILNQLRKYYGEIVYEYVHYEEKVWRIDESTFIDYQSHILPHQNNGHYIFDTEIYKNQFLLAGTETSKQYPGYMEGAVFRSWEIATKILAML